MITEPFRAQPAPLRLLRIAEVQRRVGVSRSQIYRLLADGEFPARVKLGTGPTTGTAWVESEVEQWIAGRIAARGGAQ